jgi:hypothetical protein
MSTLKLSGRFVELISFQFPCLVMQSVRQQTKGRRSLISLYWKLSKDQPETMGELDRHFYVERTLDEAYYPGLSRKDLDDRNKNQVVTRELLIGTDDRSGFRDLSHSEWGSDELYDDIPVLMVPQLWIWKFDHYIVSAYSAGEKPLSFLRNRERVGEYHIQRLNNETIDEDSPKRQIGLVVVDCIEQFGRKGEFPPALHIFEAGVARIMSNVLEYMGPNGTSKPDIEVERGFLNRISDIQGELAMIQDVLRQQKEVLGDILNDPPKDFIDPSKRGSGSDYEPWDHVIGSMKTLEKYYRLTEKISADATRIEKNIQDELNLKRTFATMEDARTSLSLGVAVIGFTVITIIFAPLAFVTALFALPIDAFEKKKIKITEGAQEEDNGVYTASYIGKWFGESAGKCYESIVETSC